MPTISQLPVANGVSAADELPLSQSGGTRSVRVDALLASTQPIIATPTGNLLGRVSQGTGLPEIVAVGAGLALQGPALSTTGTDHLAFVSSSGLEPGDEIVINSAGQPKRMQTTLLRGLFSPGIGVTIGADGTISAPGTAGPAGPQGAPGPAGSVSNTTLLPSAQASDRVALSRNGSDGSVQLVSLLASPLVTSPGRTVATSIVALAGRRLDPRDWGALFDGVHDDAPAIQAALDAAAAAGGGVVRLPDTQGGPVLIGSGLMIGKSGVRLEGPSPGGTVDNFGDNVAGGLRLVWTGSAGGTMIRLAPTADPVNGRPLIGCAVTGVVLDCRKTAATGLAVLSVRRSEFEVGVVNSTGPGVLCDTVDLGEFNDVEDCIFDLAVSNVATNGACVVLDGTSRGGAWVGNTSINRFRRMRLTYNAGDGLVVNNAARNHLEAVTAQHRPGFAAGSQLGNGRGIVLNGPTAGGVGASSNCFEYVSGDIHALAGSLYNQIRWLDVSNGSPVPSIDPTATLYVCTSHVVSSDASSARVTVADSASLAETARAARGGEALRVQAASGDHARLVSADGTVEWGLQVAPNGDFQIQARKGTGQHVSFGSASVSVAGVALGDASAAPSTPSSGIVLYSQAGQLHAVGPGGPVPIGGGGVALPSSAALLGTTAGGVAQAITLGSGLTLTGTTLTAPGGPTYILPPATSSALGGVKAGAGLTSAADGTLSMTAQPYTLPPATASVLGGVKAGNGLAVAADGTLSATAISYALPAATSTALGGVKQGANVAIAADGTISVAPPFSAAYADLTGKPAIPIAYSLPTATTSALGGVKVGANLTVAADGTVSASAPPAPYVLPAATVSVLGGIKQGAGVIIAADGTLSTTGSGGTTYTLPAATASTLGGVRAGSGLAVAGDGTLSVSYSYTLTSAGIAAALGYTAVNPSALAGVAMSGSYADLANKPAIPAAYTLPAATASTFGGVKVDGTTITAAAGTISAVQPTAYALPAATTAALGGVKPDGSSILVNGSGVISAARKSGLFPIIGDGTTTSFTVTHNFATQALLVQVLDPANANATVTTLEPTRPTANTVVVPFSAAPANGTAFNIAILSVA